MRSITDDLLLVPDEGAAMETRERPESRDGEMTESSGDFFHCTWQSIAKRGPGDGKTRSETSSGRRHVGTGRVLRRQQGVFSITSRGTLP